MNIQQNPFSVYDFLGYLIPGAISLYLILFFVGFDPADEAAIESAIKFVLSLMSFEHPEIYVPFILLSYSVGHFLSFLSTITVERYSIWAYGYPSKYLLDVSREKKDYFEGNEWVIRSAILFIVAPITLFDLIICDKLLNKKGYFYAQPLDEFLVTRLRYRINKLVGRNFHDGGDKNRFNASDSDFFRYVYHYAVENAGNHLPKMQNYVALYGFLRALTLISSLTFWGILYFVCFTVNAFSIIGSILIVVLAAIITYFLFVSFVKFYRRYTLEALMAMAVTYRLD